MYPKRWHANSIAPVLSLHTSAGIFVLSIVLPPHQTCGAILGQQSPDIPQWLPEVVSGPSELALIVRFLNRNTCCCYIDYVRPGSDSDPQQLQEGREVVQSAEEETLRMEIVCT